MDSLLAQDYPDLEIIVSDNGSTDETSAICQAYASKDARIQYHRAPENRGAVWNFSRVLQLARGDYFAWHGDDDLRSPQFVSACVRRMEETRAVLCTTVTHGIDKDGHSVPMKFGPPLQGEGPAQVIPRLFQQGYWPDIYGLIRRDALAGLQLRGGWGADVVMTLELALRGPVVHDPSAQTWLRLDYSKTAQKVATRAGSKVSWNGMTGDLLEAVSRAPLPPLQRAQAKLLTLRSILRNPTMRCGLGEEWGRYSLLVRPPRRLARFLSEGAMGFRELIRSR
jgi:hypothetical protein